MKILFYIEGRLRRPVARFADALVVDENPPVIVNAAETDLDSRIGEVGLGQVRVGAENARLTCTQNQFAGVAVGLGLDDVPRRIVQVRGVFRNERAFGRNGGELPAPAFHGNGFHRRLRDERVRLVAARVAVADAQNFPRAFDGKIDFVPRRRHHAALRVVHGNGDHAHVLAVGVDRRAVRGKLHGGGLAGGFDFRLGDDLATVETFC